MKLREAAFAVVLTASAGCVTYGVALLHEPFGWIVGGALLGGLSWLLLAE